MIVTRFAPSPTGDLHIGSLRTALYAYALAKHEKGKFILRIEDTDKKREVEGGTEKIKELLTIFGLEWDEYHVQSERVETGVYKKAAEKLVAEGKAYKDEGAIRIKIPKGEKVSYVDYVSGKEVEWETDTLEDLVMLKSDGFPTYHLAVVVDDNEMGVTHVLRGHDWQPSTPIHLLLYKFLDIKRPEIGHLTDILDPAGGKLSKRKGSVSVEGMLKEGYLPEAILNFVMLLGWAPKDNRELFTLDEFVAHFDPKGFQISNPVLNRDKLDWFNGQYVRKLTLPELIQKFEEISSKFKGLSDEKKKAIAGLLQERIKKLTDINELGSFFWEEREVDKSLFPEVYQRHLEKALDVLENTSWTKEAIDAKLIGLIEKEGFKTGDFFMSLRVAVTGSKFTPPINDSLVILEKEETIKRLRKALT